MFKTPNLQIQICTRIISAVDWKQNSTSMELKTESMSMELKTEFNQYGIENRIQPVWNWKQNQKVIKQQTYVYQNHKVFP